VGPADPTTHAALAKKVGTDGIHGINQYSNTVVVGECSNAVFQFPADLNHSLVATFISLPQLSIRADPGNTLVLTWPTNFTGFVLQKNTGFDSANWTNSPGPITVTIRRAPCNWFIRAVPAVNYLS